MPAPTVGRLVHFYTQDIARQSNGMGEGPYPATVMQTFNKDNPAHDTMANLKVMMPFPKGDQEHIRDEGSVYEKSQAEEHFYGTARYWVWPPRD